jgi:hypothetical protein
LLCAGGLTRGSGPLKSKQPRRRIPGRKIMAVISMFYGIIVSMYFFDNRRHHVPHVHVRHQDEEAVIQIPTGELLEGSLKSNKLKLVQAWVEIHHEEIMADWMLASQGEPIFKVEPLR